MEFKKYTQELTVNGHLVSVEVTIEVDEDDPAHLLDADFESDAERGEYAKKILCGQVFCGVISVKVEGLGVEGFDSLGGCELKPNNMFDSSEYERSVQSVIEEHGMVKNALDEFKFKLQLEYQRLLTESNRLKMVAQEFKQYSKVKS